MHIAFNCIAYNSSITNFLRSSTSLRSADSPLLGRFCPLPNLLQIMFAFRMTTPKRYKVYSNSTPTTNTSSTNASSVAPKKLFEATHNSKALLLSDYDNSSVDMSLYTTESKSTLRYNYNYNSAHDDDDNNNNNVEVQSQEPTEFTTEIALRMRANLGGCCYAGDCQEKPSRLFETTPAAVVISPSSGGGDEDESVASSGYDFLHQKSTISVTKRLSCAIHQTSSTAPPIDPQFQTIPIVRTPPMKRKKEWGPVDLDESIAIEASSLASSSNSWAMASNGMASPSIYNDGRIPSDKDASPPSFSYIIAPVSLVNEEEDDAPVVWTDGEEEEQEEGEEVVFQQPQKQRNHEDYKAIDLSYRQTMHSISTSKSRITENNESEAVYDWEDDSTGAVLLTRDELERHLKQTQKSAPLPSSDIEGFDKWRRRKEYQRRYFAKLQEKAVERKKEREQRRKKMSDHRQPTQLARPPSSPEKRQSLSNNRHNHANAWDSTRSAMDQSVDSSIPTLDNGSIKRRQKAPSKMRRRWGIFPIRRLSPKKTTGSSCKTSKGQNAKQLKVVTLSQFIRISCDEPSVVVEDMSLAPLNKLGQVTMASSLPGRDTMELARKHIEIERQKQRQSELDKQQEEKQEQERIRNLKQKEIERQRRMNRQQPHLPPLSYPPKTGSFVSSARSKKSVYSCLFKEPKSIQSKETDSTTEFSLTSKSLSICSKQSGNSSIQSTLTLSPCIICNAAERSHVSMPCMHFAFCEECVEMLYQSETVECPVCSTSHVAFTQVFTGV